MALALEGGASAATLAAYPNPPPSRILEPHGEDPKALRRRPRQEDRRGGERLPSTAKNKESSDREVLRPRKQATAMETPLKIPGSPRDFHA